MTLTEGPRRPVVLAVFLLVTGVIGWLGSVALLAERIATLVDPDHVPTCDVNPFISCGALFDTWQASLLGFPNPILGVAGFVAPIAVGTALLAGARFARWFWILFHAGVFAAWLFVTWLFSQSVFVLGVLCPYCMLVWAVTIPMFWYLAVWSAREGHFGPRLTRFGGTFLPFAWVLVLVNYLVIVFSIIIQFPLLLAIIF